VTSPNRPPCGDLTPHDQHSLNGGVDFADQGWCPGVPNLAEPAAQQPLSRSDEPSEVAAIRRLTRHLNQPMINRLRRCADRDTGDGSWGEATIYTPEAIQLVALVDAVDALLGLDGTARDARVRAQALRDFAEAMRVLAEDAPADEPAKWPWSGYALAAVKAEEYAGKGFPIDQGSIAGDSGTQAPRESP
jgi:hypothetical protein